VNRYAVRDPTRPSSFPQDVQLTQEQTDTIVAAIAVALEDAKLIIDTLTAAIAVVSRSWAGDLVMPVFQDMSSYNGEHRS